MTAAAVESGSASDSSVEAGDFVKPYVSDPDFTLYVGDVRDVLRELPDESVDCVATSPPFYGLRDYGVDGQIGLEDSLQEWVAELVAVFAECRRVLRSSGTLWVECGDSYNAGTGAGRQGQTGQMADRSVVNARLGGNWTNDTGGRRVKADVKVKDLLGQPWELAFALRADGWWLRQSIIWHKPNAMPESATDRCTTAHSYVFLLSKAARYHFDAGAIAEPAEWARWGDQTVPKYEGTDTATGWMQPKTKGELEQIKTKKPDGWDTGPGGHGSIHRNGREKGEVAYVNPGNRTTNGEPRTEERRGFDNRLERADGMKNARSVWTIPTQGYPEAHFATWPEALAERIILAGCPKGGTVLDPFFGSGTTGVVARRLGRNVIGVELNEEYARLAVKRMASWWKSPRPISRREDEAQQSLLAEEVA
jgi:DNA modification methylase